MEGAQPRGGYRCPEWRGCAASAPLPCCPPARSSLACVAEEERKWRSVDESDQAEKKVLPGLHFIILFGESFTIAQRRGMAPALGSAPDDMGRHDDGRTVYIPVCDGDQGGVKKSGERERTRGKKKEKKLVGGARSGVHRLLLPLKKKKKKETLLFQLRCAMG